MKKAVVTTLMIMFLGTQAYALDREALKKEIIEEVRKEMNAGGNDSSPFTRLSFSGVIEADFLDVNEKKTDESESDLSVGTVEFGVNVKINEMVEGRVLFKAENLSKEEDEDGEGGEDFLVDEAFVTLTGEKGLYAVAGKNAKPFGQFLSHTISDPETVDAYEVAVAGLTVGYAPEDMMGLDLSITVYKSAEMMHDYTSDAVESWILNLTLSPAEGALAGVAFASEPGEGDRSSTLNVFAEYGAGPVTLHAEYFTAIAREENEAGKEAKESAVVIGAAWQATDALEIALRYESHDYDRDAEEGDLDNIVVAGCAYTAFDSLDLMAEYRGKKLESAGNSSFEDQIDEVNVRIALGF